MLVLERLSVVPSIHRCWHDNQYRVIRIALTPRGNASQLRNPMCIWCTEVVPNLPGAVIDDCGASVWGPSGRASAPPRDCPAAGPAGGPRLPQSGCCPDSCAYVDSGRLAFTQDVLLVILVSTMVTQAVCVALIHQRCHSSHHQHREGLPLAVY